MTDRIIQPSPEFEQEHKNNLINVAPAAPITTATKTLSPDELDQAQKLANQKANAMIAEVTMKSLTDKPNPGETPYNHTSTYGLGSPDSFWSNLFAVQGLLPKKRSQKIFYTLLFAIVGVVAVLQYLLS